LADCSFSARQIVVLFGLSAGAFACRALLTLGAGIAGRAGLALRAGGAWNALRAGWAWNTLRAGWAAQQLDRVLTQIIDYEFGVLGHLGLLDREMVQQQSEGAYGRRPRVVVCGGSG
jgi:hypothetical protein